MLITKELMKDYRTVQEGGLTNMYDIEMVLNISESYKLDNLATFIREHGSKGYVDLLRAYDQNVQPDCEVVKHMHKQPQKLYNRGFGEW